MKRIVLTFGLLAGAVLSVMMVITFALGDRIDYDKGEIIGYTTMVAAFLMIYFGVRSYRDNVLDGTIGFGRAFKVGLLITVVASACYVATWQVVYRKMAPDYGEKYMAHQLEKLRAEGATEEQIATESREMAKLWELYKNPLVNVAMTLLEPLPVGLVMTLVSAGILARRRRRMPVGSTQGATVAR
jgi:hypothetical protein